MRISFITPADYHSEEKHRDKFAQSDFLAAAAAVAMGSSAFANTYLNEMGTADLHPIINQSYAPS
jgi:hypothetical protein